MLEEGLDQLHRQAVWHIVCYDGRLEKGFEACSLPLGPRCRTYPLERVFSQLDEQRGCVELAYRSAARSLLGLVTDPRLSGSSLTKLNINILHHALYNEGQSTPFAKELEVPPPRTGDARYSAPASGLRNPLGVRLVALSSGFPGNRLARPVWLWRLRSWRVLRRRRRGLGRLLCRVVLRRWLITPESIF
jgi:hypothetical protein